MNPRIIEEFLNFMVSWERRSRILAIVLKWLFLMTFTIIVLPILALRSRLASDVVESDKGGADDEGAKKLSHDYVAGDDCSPPSDRAPPQLSLKEKVIVCFLAMFLGAWICGPLKNACVEAERRHENKR